MDDAQVTAERLLAVNPKLAPVPVIRGTVFLQKARLEDAEAAFRKAVEADPQSIQAQYQLARVQVLRNRRTDAIASFRKLQQLDPSRQLGRLELIGLESGQDPAAIGEAMVREIRDLLQKQPDQPSLHIQLGAVLFAQGKTDEAEAAFRGALTLDGGSVPASLGVAQVALRRGKPEDALEFVDDPCGSIRTTSRPT
jgi:cytochrome c-type biogenesis protein CcmH/NrfG